MKVVFLFGYLLILFQSNAQQNNVEIDKIVMKFQNCFNSLADTSKAQSEKNKAMSDFAPCFETNNVPFLNFFAEQPSFLPIKDFINTFRTEFPNGKTSTSIKKRGVILPNESRNCYTSETTLEFILSNPVSADSLGIVQFEDKKVELLLITKHDKEGNNFKNPKIISVSSPQQKAFNDLSQNTQWWVSLDGEWKDIFRKKLSFAEFPSELEIKNIFFIFDLDLSNSKLKTYEPLLKLNELRKLNLKDAEISNSLLLASCTYLGELNLSGSKVRDIAGLSGLKSMRKLFLNNLELVDISPLADMSKLIELEINENKIKDLTPLKSLSNLEKLQCSINEFTDINALSSLQKLTDVRFGKNQVESLTPLQNIPDLVRIDAFNNKIKDLSPLRNCKKLAWLHIDFNPITNLEPISNLCYLIYLSMAHTLVKDLSPLKNLSILDRLNIVGTEISSLGPVKNMTRLSELKMNNTKISKGEAADYKKNNPKCKITYY
ncbi:MAG: leucine-rich repeat domain-containing protein [Cytophagales bacterium]